MRLFVAELFEGSRGAQSCGQARAFTVENTAGSARFAALERRVEHQRCLRLFKSTGVLY